MRSKIFELLDFPKFASPTIDGILVPPTAGAIGERLITTSFLSYGQIWPKLDDVVRHGVSDAYLIAHFSSYRDDWKNRAIQSAVRALAGLIGRKGVWYRVAMLPRSVLGFVFKTSIRGVWFYENQAYAVLVNARKSQRLSQADVAFLARGIYELYCIDDPNDPLPMIIDLSAKPGEKARSPVAYVLSAEDAMPLAAFEETLRVFMDAMASAGVASPMPADAHIVDLFRGRPF